MDYSLDSVKDVCTLVLYSPRIFQHNKTVLLITGRIEGRTRRDVLLMFVLMRGAEVSDSWALGY